MEILVLDLSEEMVLFGLRKSNRYHMEVNDLLK